MFRIGLSSSAFLASSCEDVVARAKELGFEGLEWAGAPHLGAGDREAARRVMHATLRAGLTIVSYAPLYRVVPGGGRGLSFEAILDTARDIYAPVIRVYAGEGSRQGPGDRAAFLDELRRIGDEAGRHGIGLALSPDRRSLMPGLREGASCAAELAHPFVGLSWEPGAGELDESAALLEESPELFSLLRPRAFDREGRPIGLETEADRWRRLIEAFSAKPGHRDIGRFLLLGGIGDRPDETLAADMAFVRSARPEPRRGGGA